jgi:hypothetical protein
LISSVSKTEIFFEYLNLNGTLEEKAKRFVESPTATGHCLQ